MLDWVFSERFELRTFGLRKEVSLSCADARMIASAACRSQKRILFLLTVLCRSGLSTISYMEIAKLIGTSRNAVANSILKLLANGKIRRHIGGHYLTADGHYGTERNQYTVPLCKQKRDESTAEFSLGEVKENFDASYIRCMELLTDQEKRQYFSPKELVEMTGVQEEALIRIDLEGQPHAFQSDVYGMLVAYEYNGVRYYPLLDVVKCLKVNQPRTIVQRCKEKKLFAIPAGRQIADKGFVDAACLRGILERSKSTEKQPLMDWLLPSITGAELRWLDASGVWQRSTLTDEASLSTLRTLLSTHQEVGALMAGCPFGRRLLTLTFEGGAQSTLDLACDSCSIFRVEGREFRYAHGMYGANGKSPSSDLLFCLFSDVPVMQ